VPNVPAIFSVVIVFAGHPRNFALREGPSCGFHRSSPFHSSSNEILVRPARSALWAAKPSDGNGCYSSGVFFKNMCNFYKVVVSRDTSLVGVNRTAGFT
jgi:hypothetical protein